MKMQFCSFVARAAEQIIDCHTASLYSLASAVATSIGDWIFWNTAIFLNKLSWNPQEPKICTIWGICVTAFVEILQVDFSRTISNEILRFFFPVSDPTTSLATNWSQKAGTIQNEIFQTPASKNWKTRSHVWYRVFFHWASPKKV